MTYYKYTTYGWYDGTTEYSAPYTTKTPPPKQETEIEGYQFNWHDKYWAYVPYVEPPDPVEVGPVVPEPPPLLPEDTRLTPMAFVRRFGLQEEMALRQLAKTDIVVESLLSSLYLVEYVDLLDERVITGLQYLVTNGVITQERADEILKLPVQPFEK